MRETPRLYQRRILNYSANKDPERILRATPNKIRRLIRSLSKRQLRWRPASRKWAIAEILAHLADTELAFGFRYRQVLTQSGIVLQAFDQDAWAINGKYKTFDPKDFFTLFCVIRAANLRLLKTMPRSRWNYYGIHEERGKETIRTMASLEAGHDINHLRQIERIAADLRRRKRWERPDRCRCPVLMRLLTMNLYGNTHLHLDEESIRLSAVTHKDFFQIV